MRHLSTDTKSLGPTTISYRKRSSQKPAHSLETKNELSRFGEVLFGGGHPPPGTDKRALRNPATARQGFSQPQVPHFPIYKSNLTGPPTIKSPIRSAFAAWGTFLRFSPRYPISAHSVPRVFLLPSAVPHYHSRRE